MEKKVFCAVSVILIFAMVVCSVHVMGIHAKEKKNIVVLYFSVTGTTKGAAKRIKNATGGKMIFKRTIRNDFNR